MPSRNSGGRGQYNLVQSDDLDTRVPLMPDEAFQQGIQFNCKFIGSMDIPRPTSRVEIVAAMRRIRFEFKQKGIKKKKVTVTISVNGIKTTLRKRKTKKRRIGRNKDVYVDVENSLLIESHPIYRIFYVSHDSQDVKIFSYIARETSTNVFHCCVFKALKKAQAMRIVRTVGQAFEVCHKLVGAPDEDNNVDDGYHPDKKEEIESVPSSPIKRGGSVEDKTTSSSSRAHKLFSKLGRRTSELSSSDKENGAQQQKMKMIEECVPTNKNNRNSPTEEKVVGASGESHNVIKETDPARKRPGDLNLTQQQHREQEDLVNLSTPVTPTLAKNPLPPSPIRRPGGVFQFGSQNEVWLSQQNSNTSSMAAMHESHLLREKLEQQQQQTQAALAQINLLRDQLAAESSARIEAQARTHQLLLHNKELLDHLQSLVRHIQEVEGRMHQNTSGSSMNNSPAPALPQVSPPGSHHHHQQHLQQHSFFSPSYPPPPTSSPSPPISFQEIESLRRQNSALLETILYEQNARNFFNYAAAASIQSPNVPNSVAATPSALRLASATSPFHHFTHSYFPPPPTGLVVGNPGLGLGHQLVPDNYATIFTSRGEPVDSEGRLIIRPLQDDAFAGSSNKTLLSLPTPKSPPKLGAIGRNASADEAREQDDEETSAQLRRQHQGVLGRSVSEKIGHRSELMSQVQRTTWARHTTK